METLATNIKYVFYSATSWVVFICLELFSDLLSYTQGPVSIVARKHEYRSLQAFMWGTGAG